MAVAGDAQIFLEWSAPSGDWIDAYIIFMDDVERSRVTATLVTISHLSNGQSYSFRVVAHNEVGNGPSSSAVLATPAGGASALNVTITTPSNNSYNNTGSVTVRWTVSGDAPLERTEIGRDGANWTILSGMSAVLTELADGRYTIFVRATDVDGRESTASVVFTVDTVAPVITELPPMGNEESTRVVITVTFSEAMDRTVTTITVNDTTGTMMWSGNSASFTPWEALHGDTVYTVTVEGQDLAGNPLAPVSWTFKTAKVGTVSGVIYDENGNPIANATVTLTTMTGAHLERSSLPQAALAAANEVLVTMTDEQGRYWFYDVAVGSFTLQATKEGYVPQNRSVSMTLASVAGGGILADLTIKEMDNTMLWAMIGVVTGSLVVILLLLLVRRRKKEDTEEKNEVEEGGANGKRLKK